MTKMVVFDLDGTLTKSKMAIDGEMAKMVEQLSDKMIVAVTSGASFKQFKKQLLGNLEFNKQFSNLLLLPTNGASFYRYKEGKWQKIYQHLIKTSEKAQIKVAFKKVYEEIGYKNPDVTYGNVLEDRGSQITFEALGQKAPLSKRREWNKTSDRRKEIKKALDKYLRPKFQVMIAGLTSIDILEKGIDKSFGISTMRKIFRLKKDEVAFVGDAIRPGANDFEAIKSGVEMIKVTGPEETKKIIKSWL